MQFSYKVGRFVYLRVLYPSSLVTAGACALFMSYLISPYFDNTYLVMLWLIAILVFFAIFAALLLGGDLLIAIVFMFCSKQAGKVVRVTVDENGWTEAAEGSTISVKWDEVKKIKYKKRYIKIRAGSKAIYTFKKDIGYDTFESLKAVLKRWETGGRV